MEMLQGVWKQHLRPRAVVGYGVKSFPPSPPNYVTRSPGCVSKLGSHFIQHFCRSLKLAPPPQSHPLNFIQLDPGISQNWWSERDLNSGSRRFHRCIRGSFRGKFVKTKENTSKVIENCRPRIRYRITSSSDGKKI